MGKNSETFQMFFKRLFKFFLTWHCEEKMEDMCLQHLNIIWKMFSGFSYYISGYQKPKIRYNLKK